MGVMAFCAIGFTNFRMGFLSKYLFRIVAIQTKFLTLHQCELFAFSHMWAVAGSTVATGNRSVQNFV